MARIVKPARFIISFSLVILILVFGGYKLFQVGKIYFGYGNSTFEKVSTISVKKNNDETNQKISIPFRENIILYYNNNLKAYTINGEESWSLGQKVGKPALYRSESLLYLVDKSTGYINAIDGEGAVKWTVDLGKAIQGFTVNTASISTIVLEKETGGIEVLVFDIAGQDIGRIDISKGSIMEVAISEDGEIIALSILTTEKDVLETNIVLYSKEGKLLGGNKYDDEIIGSMFFSKDKSLISIGVDNIVCFSKEKGLLWTKNVPHSINKLAWNREDLLALNFVNKKKSILDTKSQNHITIIDVLGENLLDIPIKDTVIDMDFMGDNVVAAGNRTLYFINKQSKELIEKKINKDIKGIHFINKNQLAVLMEGKIEIFNLD